MTTLTVRAYGRPAPQGSHEIGANGHVMHSSNYLAGWRRQVELAAYATFKAAGIAGAQLPVFRHSVPVFVHELTLIVTDEQCRAAGTDEPTGRPDVDKLLRATVDGLGDARVFLDDSQIVKIYELSKARPAAGQQPGAIIIISDRPRPVIEQGESMTSTDEYRVALEKIGRDGDGDRVYETTFELFGTAGQCATVGLTALGALLGAGRVTVVDSSTAREAQAELGPEQVDTAPAGNGETKRPRGRPRKATAAAAEPAAAGPEAPAAPVAEPVTAPAAQTPAQPVAVTTTFEGAQPAEPGEQLPAAPAGRVNPFG